MLMAGLYAVLPAGDLNRGRRRADRAIQLGCDNVLPPREL